MSIPENTMRIQDLVLSPNRFYNFASSPDKPQFGEEKAFEEASKKIIGFSCELERLNAQNYTLVKENEVLRVHDKARREKELQDRLALVLAENEKLNGILEGDEVYKKARHYNPRPKNEDDAPQDTSSTTEESEMDQLRRQMEDMGRSLQATTYLAQACSLWNRGEIDAALVLLENVIKIDNKNGHAYKTKGHILSEKGQLNEAIAAYKKATEIDPKDEDAYNSLGDCYMKQGKFTEAIETYLNIVNNLESTHAYEKRGFCCHQLGFKEEATMWYDKQLETTPHRWSAHIKKGKTLHDLNKDKEALESFQKGVNIIHEGKLEGRYFVYNGKTEMLTELEAQLITCIKGVVSVPVLKMDKESLFKEDIDELNDAKEELKQKLVDLLQNVGINEISQEQLNELNKKVEVVKNRQQKIRNDCKDMVNVEESQDRMLRSGMTEKSRFNEQVDKLDPASRSYYKAFLWTSKTLFDAYLRPNNGLAERNLETEGNEQVGLMQSAQKPVTAPSNFDSSVPSSSLFDMIDNAIDGVYNKVKESGFQSRISARKRIAQTKFNDEFSFKKVALAITSKRERILNSRNNASSELKAGVEWLTVKVNEIKEKASSSSREIRDLRDPEVAQALRDVTLVIAYLFKNYESISNNQRPVDEQLLSPLTKDGFEHLFKDWSQPVVEPPKEVQPPKKKSCFAKLWSLLCPCLSSESKSK